MSETRERDDRRIGSLRLRFGAQTAALILMATIVSLAGASLAARHSARFDVTATRAQSLSERTRRVLDTLDGPREIIVVADAGALPGVVWQRAGDVLDAFDRADDRVRVTIIDAADPDAPGRFRALIDRLRAMHADALTNHIDATRAGAEAAITLASGVERLGEALQRAARAMPADLPQGEQLDGQAAVARLRANELRTAGQAAGEALGRTIAGSDVPQVDLARAELLAPLSALGEEMAALAGALRRLADAMEQREQSGAEALREAADLAEGLRDQAARRADALERLGSLRLLSILRAVEQRNAVIVASDSDARAVRFDALFPSQRTIDEAGGGTADIRFVGEDIIATALASLAAESQPAVILAHALPTTLLDESGLPRANEAGLQVAGLVSRLSMRGVDVLEWAVDQSPEAPASVARLGDADRPVVWCVIGTVSVTGDAVERNQRLFDLVAELVSEGENILLCAAPSTLPSVGEPDPLVRPFEVFGVEVDTARPLMERSPSPTGPTVRPSVQVRSGGEAHPVGRAVSGLVVELPWATPMTIEQTPGAGAWPVLTFDGGEDVWGESRWLDFWSMPQQQRNRLRDPPAPDPQRDRMQESWTLAAAAERSNPVDGPPQRVLLVGASGWFFDAFTQRTQVVDGRTVQVAPGNMELFELSIFWLAGRDEWIGASARSTETPRIENLSARQVTVLRWALIVGLPAMVLALGAGLRVARG